MLEMIAQKDELWFLPLGGTGEIGMNLNLYGHDGQWLMVDCGVTFPKPGPAGADGVIPPRSEPDVQMPDPSFIADQRDRLSGLVITHAHEDHVGAVPYLWPLLQCPVYTSPFTAEILRRKLSEFGLLGQVPIKEVAVGDIRRIGPFSVEWLALTHSIPNPSALMIRSPAGSIVHTGDWKLDDNPVIGHGYSANTFLQLGEQGVDALVCDSTNAHLPGRSTSEAALHRGLLNAISGARGRVVVTTFGSNIARLHTLSLIARETGRYMALLGRSLANMGSAATAAGVWDADQHLIEPAHVGYLPPEEVLAVATGSQGDSRAALRRLAEGKHPDMELGPGDRVIFSARTIPGNEEAVEDVISRLQERDIEVLTPDNVPYPIHASGHPAEEELKDMYQWVRPRIAIPVHGEEMHLNANAAVARACDVPATLLGRDGDLYTIAPVPGIRRQVAHTGRVGWEKGALVPIAARS